MMTDETYRSKLSKGHWRLPLPDRDALLQAYTAAENLLAHYQDLDVLREAFRNYFRYVVHLGITHDTYAAKWTIANAAHMEAPLLRSAIHRLNCQVMRYLAGEAPCHHTCCCRCTASYPSITCNEVLGYTPPPPEPDQVN